MSTDPLSQVRLDRHSPVPLYYQAATQLAQAIRDGRLAVGTRLDNEIELANRLGLSRPTMRRAIGELVDDGLVVRQRGVGTRVVSAEVLRPVELTSLYDDLVAAGSVPFTQVLELAQVSPDADLAQAFGSDEPLWRITRLRGTETGPLAIMHNWVSTSIDSVSLAALQAGGLYEILRLAGADLHIARATIGACQATPDEAAQLEIEPGSACVTMLRDTFDHAGCLIERGDHLCRGDKYHFVSTITAR